MFIYCISDLEVHGQLSGANSTARPERNTYIPNYKMLLSRGEKSHNVTPRFKSLSCSKTVLVVAVISIPGPKHLSMRDHHAV